jgi:hypothetical protein
MWLQSIITINFAVNEATKEVSLFFSVFSDADISIVGRSAQSALITMHLVEKAQKDLTLMLLLSSVIRCAACLISGNMFVICRETTRTKRPVFKPLIFRLFTRQMAMIWTSYSLVSCIALLAVLVSPLLRLCGHEHFFKVKFFVLWF